MKSTLYSAIFFFAIQLQPALAVSQLQSTDIEETLKNVMNNYYRDISCATDALTVNLDLFNDPALTANRALQVSIITNVASLLDSFRFNSSLNRDGLNEEYKIEPIPFFEDVLKREAVLGNRYWSLRVKEYMIRQYCYDNDFERAYPLLMETINSSEDFEENIVKPVMNPIIYSYTQKDLLFIKKRSLEAYLNGLAGFNFSNYVKENAIVYTDGSKLKTDLDAVSTSTVHSFLEKHKTNALIVTFCTEYVSNMFLPNDAFPEIISAE